MATTRAPQGGSFIVITIMIAMLLMLVPLPDNLRFARPEWVLMTLIYWAMALPQRIGVGYAWCVGLLMDVLMGGSLGVEAFSYAFVIYLILRFHLQLRQYPLWQQALSIMAFVLVVNIPSVLMASNFASWYVWLPAVTTTVLWPIVYAFLRAVRRAFNVS
ncbi:MAG: rod shape-determining protein MreD [Pseudomonadota bacterium]|nr:rod shape-determining protein MreD [Pseudomonadota bacterium]MDO7666845.1 rod shape-determining protein MreD [Pseudomonadota bacterium]MDO7711825.1 rod shape-determining protein MreD [Pseudomonadota bacterium]